MAGQPTRACPLRAILRGVHLLLLSAAVALAAVALAVSTASASAAVRIGTWNIQTLAAPGRKVFPDQDHVRSPADLAMLPDQVRGLRDDLIGLRGRDLAEYPPPVPDGERPRDFRKRYADHRPRTLRVTP